MAIFSIFSKFKALIPVGVVGGAIAITIKLLTASTPLTNNLLNVPAVEDIAETTHEEELEEPEEEVPPEEEEEADSSPETDTSQEEEAEAREDEGQSDADLEEAQEEKPEEESSKKEDEKPAGRTLTGPFKDLLSEILQ